MSASVKHPHYRCDSEDHPVPVDLVFEGWFGDGPQFRRYICPACEWSYPEGSLQGRPIRDPRFVAVPGLTSAFHPLSRRRRTVTFNGEVIGEIEYLYIPSAGSPSTGSARLDGWRPAGSRIRNPRTRYEAERLVYEKACK